MINLSSDYLEGCHPSILKKLSETNLEQTPGYGLDPYCEQAADAIRKVFACPDSDVHFLVGGTQSNAVIISSILRPYEGVLCASSGHINVHETGAVEATGHKVLPLASRDGTISSAQVNVAVALQGEDEHVVRPGMVYISLATELGTVYSLVELKDLYYTCRQNGLYLYVDGARLGYALASPITDLRIEDIAKYSDVFTVGGTKQGALFGEAVVISNPDLKKNFRYMMKRSGALLAKGRLLGIQFLELMRNNLYFTLAKKAVDAAMRIRDALLERKIPLLVDSPTNQLFPILTDEQLESLEENFELTTWERVDELHTAVRICTSWCTPDASVDAVIAAIRKLQPAAVSS